MIRAPLKKNTNNILYISTFPPRECGIATFTRDLTAAFDAQFNPITKSKIVALNESQTSFYNYPAKVIDSVAANNLENYVALAEKVNKNEDIKLINIQHEFGIFGGGWGDYLIPFLQVVKKPVVITFHSVIPGPNDELRHVVRILSNKSKAFVVMNGRSKKTLEDEYDIPKSKIFLIPHGIPDVTFESNKNAKAELGLEGKTILTTFGLLSRGKGIENVIDALPKVVKQYPDILYIVLGATHPVIIREEGESYRNFLYEEVERLNLKNHVKFYNKYLSLDEIISYLKASDIYLSTSIDEGQSVSGTLSYAMGCGRAVISTATEYAKHIIKNEENGILVDFNNPGGIANAIGQLLDDEKFLKSLHQNAYESTRHMTWPNVSAAYFRLYKKFIDIEKEEKKLPVIKLDHLVRLTDDFGIIHHARYSKPEKRFGYSLDDNARALIAAADYYQKDSRSEIINPMKTYLRFIKFAQKPNGAFTNIINSKKERSDSISADAQGRAIWALGYVASQEKLPKEITVEADRVFHKALRHLRRINTPRAIAFAMVGIYHHLKNSPQRNLLSIFKKLADQQVKFYNENSSANWGWFEDHLSYSNGKLPESLFYAYDLTKNKKYLDVAEASLKFLKEITFESKHYSPIGQNGWYFRYSKRTYFDQQPEDAASMVHAKIAAYKITGNKKHLEDAYKAFSWFLGRNHLNQMVYNEVTGGCHDGLGQSAMNLNQGAESTLSYLLARLSFEDSEIKQAISAA